MNQKITEIRKQFLSGKGYNFNKKGQIKQYKSGYMVALKSFEKIINKNEPNLNELIDLEIEKKLNQLESGQVIGFWEEKDLIYIDISIRIKDLKIAKALGRLNNQIAIWDNRQQKAITL